MRLPDAITPVCSHKASATRSLSSSDTRRNRQPRGKPHVILCVALGTSYYTSSLNSVLARSFPGYHIRSLLDSALEHHTTTGLSRGFVASGTPTAICIHSDGDFTTVYTNLLRHWSTRLLWRMVGWKFANMGGQRTQDRRLLRRQLGLIPHSHGRHQRGHCPTFGS